MRKLKVLPPMRCDDGCGDCCGVVPVTETEYRAVERYAKAHGITPLDQNDTCPFFQNGTCAVYDVRPTLCRLFGHTPGMTCPHGYNVNVPDRDVDRIMRSSGLSTLSLRDAGTGGANHTKRLLHDLVSPEAGARARGYVTEALFGTK